MQNSFFFLQEREKLFVFAGWRTKSILLTCVSLVMFCCNKQNERLSRRRCFYSFCCCCNHSFRNWLDRVYNRRIGSSCAGCRNPRVRKALQTLLALKRFLTAVQSLVLRQVVLVFKCLWAHVTLVRSKDVDLKISHNKILLVIAGAQNSTSITIQFTGLVNRDSSY